MLVHKFEHLLHQTFGALVLDVSFGRRQKCAHRIDINATLNESGTSATQLLEPIVIGCIHDAEQSAWLQCYAAGVNVLDQLTKDIRLEFFNDQRLMLLTCRLLFA